MAAAMRQYEAVRMHKSSVESFYSVEETERRPAMVMTAPQLAVARPVRPTALRVQTAHRRYQSDEEIPSPGLEEDYSEGQDSSTEDVAIDETIDLEHLEPLAASLPEEEAHQVRIVFCGKPSLIDIGRVAPMQRRRRPAIAPESHSSTLPQPPVSIPRRSSRRRNQSVSMYEPATEESTAEHASYSAPVQSDLRQETQSASKIGDNPSATMSSSYLSISSRNSSVTNFSTPLRQTNRPRPTAQHNHSHLSYSTTSTDADVSSLPPRLSRGPESPVDPEPTEIILRDSDEGEALMRESAEIQIRTASSERQRRMALVGDLAGPDYYDEQDDLLNDYHMSHVVPGLHAKKSNLVDEEDRSELTNGLEEEVDGPLLMSHPRFDPYGMQPSNVDESRGRRGSAAVMANAAKKGWKGITRAGRRRGAIVA